MSPNPDTNGSASDNTPLCLPRKSLLNSNIRTVHMSDKNSPSITEKNRGSGSPGAGDSEDPE